jgi:hypothetical protein
MSAGQRATNQTHASTVEAAASAEAAEQSAAAAADAAFMQLLLLLAQRAAFVPLSERDVALGVSLNTDFLWQLFVKVSTEQLDSTLVPPQLLAAAAAGAAASPASAVGAAASAAAGTAPAQQQLKETDSLLVLRWAAVLATTPFIALAMGALPGACNVCFDTYSCWAGDYAARPCALFLQDRCLLFTCSFQLTTTDSRADGYKPAG